MIETFQEFFKKNTARSLIPGLPPEVPVNCVLVQETGNRNSERGGQNFQQVWLLPSGAGVIVDGIGANRPLKPKKLRQRLENQTAYFQARHELAKNAFEKLRDALLGRVDEWGRPIMFGWNNKEDEEFGIHPSDECEARGTAALTRLRDLVRIYKQMLKKIEKQYNSLDDVAEEIAAVKKRAERKMISEQQSEAKRKYDRQQIAKITL